MSKLRDRTKRRRLRRPVVRWTVRGYVLRAAPQRRPVMQRYLAVERTFRDSERTEYLAERRAMRRQGFLVKVTEKRYRPGDALTYAHIEALAGGLPL